MQQTEATLRLSEARYRSLFHNLLEGFAYCQMLFEDGQPRDFIYLAVNPPFDQLTGLKYVVGRSVTDVIPGIQEAEPELFEIYGRVALTSRPEHFEILFHPLDLWLSISVYSPEKEYFIAVFDNITDRKQAELLIQAQKEQLAAQNEGLAAQLDTPCIRKGQQARQRYEPRTPAMAAGLIDPMWTVEELLLFSVGG